MQNNPESNKSVNKEYESSNGWEDVANLVKESWNKEVDHATEHATDFYLLWTSQETLIIVDRSLSQKTKK